MSTPKPERGILGIIGVLVGVGCLLVTLVSLLNTVLGQDWALSVYGTSTALPNTYAEVGGLAAAGVLIIGFSMFGGFVLTRFKAAKGRPLVRVGILVAALGLLFLVGRGLQIVALKSTYGSMLAYYATDGDLDDVRAELTKGPDKNALDQAVSRAAQYNNAAALALLLEHGADLMDATGGEYRSCALNGTNLEFIKAALDHGVRPETCYQSEALIWETVRSARGGDAETAKTVVLLASNGWSKSRVPDADKLSPAVLATRRELPLTAAALE